MSPLLLGHLEDGDEVSFSVQRSLLKPCSQLSLGL